MTSSKSVAVVTSRLRRLLVPEDSWVNGLRAVLRQIASDGAMLIIGEGTAGADFIRRAAIRLNVPFTLVGSGENSADSGSEVPARDRALIHAAESVYVLSLRSSGNVHRLLTERLLNHDGLNHDGQTALVDLPDLQDESARSDLLSHGAVLWKPEASQLRPFEGQPGALIDPRIGSVNPDHVYEIVPFPQSDEWDMLIHTTRSCPGPWPDESFDSYADSLFESRADSDHSSLGALRRITMHRRLIASEKMIRGGHRVVSFTACPLNNLLSLHRFRRHRIRWDFEPFGICIRQDWLKKRGTRPVCYGDEDCWKSMSDSDRPYFQVAAAQTAIDWAVEREWRHFGDLDLTGLTDDDAMLFVPDSASARSAANWSPWPVTLAPSDETDDD